MARMLTPARAADVARSGVAAALWTAGSALLLLAPLPFGATVPAGLAALPLDKLAHAAIFFALARSWRRWLGAARPGLGRRPLAAGVLSAAVVWGALLELGQLAAGSGRRAEWGDVASDAAGALLSLAFRF